MIGIKSHDCTRVMNQPGNHMIGSESCANMVILAVIGPESCVNMVILDVIGPEARDFTIVMCQHGYPGCDWARVT